MRKMILLFSLSSFILGCDPIDARLTIINNSPDSIYYDYSFNYPDTGLPEISPILKGEVEINHKKQSINNFDGYHQGIKPYDTLVLRYMGDFEQSVKDNPHKKLLIFIYDTDTIQKYTWEEVRKENKIMKRYELTVQELKQSNWTIIYPND